MPSDIPVHVESHLAPYATRSCDGGHRVHPEPPDPLRSPFELDRHRIIESAAFRRMEHKTQVFVATQHDFFRTRLTHTLEVADIARCLAERLRANEQLAEAVSLAHDLGHPPFGHAGEVALDEAMADFGGFNHNVHSLRVVEFLEHPFPAFRGLNLTAATRAGLHTHQTRYDRPAAEGHATAVTDPNAKDTTGAPPVGSNRGVHRSPEGTGAVGMCVRPSVESQIASLADRIAYNCHDLEDAIGSGFLGFDDLSDVALWREALERTMPRSSEDHVLAVRRIILEEMLRTVLTDVVRTARHRLQGITSGGNREATSLRASSRAMGYPLVAPSAAVESKVVELERFLSERFYRHPEILRMDAQGRAMVLALFEAYRSNPQELPARFAARIDGQGVACVVRDYMAGMTDRFCQREHARLVAAGAARPDTPAVR